LEALLTSRDVSALLRVSVSTLCRWRDRGDGPPWLNLAGVPRYRLDDVSAWLQAQRHERY
jgi:predicted site-specific integrase-resolvase